MAHRIRWLLRRLLQTFALPAAGVIWYRRFFPLVTLIVVVAGGVVVWNAGTTMLVDLVNAATGTPPRDSISVGVHASLVVAWIALVGLVIAVVNLAIRPFRDDPLVVAIPETLYSWLAGMTAVGIGLLIGTSIFR
jgi:NADH:ubiquinone oxidoreductase subunit 6 (subunit J)